MFDVENIRKEINEQLKLWNQPSMSFGVIKDGEVVFADGFGMADEAKGVKSNADTLYQIGSCSKSFTAVAVAKCVDDGLVGWDDPVVKYLPWFQLKDADVTDRVTIRDLLCHRTGLPRHDLYWILNEVTRQGMVEAMSKMNSCWTLRNHWFYNNFCFVTAGMIVEKVSGLTWEDFLKEKILKPLSMNRTYFFIDDMQADENHAVPYQLVHNAQNNEYEQIDIMRFAAENKENNVGAPYGPAGSIISCANDMLKWVNFIINLGKVGETQLVSEANMKEVTRPQMLLENALIKDWPEMDFYSYGLGWFIESYRGHKMVEHGGNLPGFSGLMLTIPDQKIGVVGFVNYNGSFMHYAQAYQVVDDYLEAEQKDWHNEFRTMIDAMRSPEAQKAQKEHLYGKKVENTATSLPLESFVGTYVNPCYGTAKISLTEKGLFLDMGLVHSDLEHYHFNSFEIADVKSMIYSQHITFQLDKKGNIGSFESDIAMPAATEVFVKVEEK